LRSNLLIGDIAALLVTLGLTGPLLRLRGLRWVRHLGNPLIALAPLASKESLATRGRRGLIAVGMIAAWFGVRQK
jgi:hypothetical protein